MKAPVGIDKRKQLTLGKLVVLAHLDEVYVEVCGTVK
jgi:hypothetical protein